ncbi:MAG: hypothetical protein HKP55_12520 [Gammaproteobacteria bacterium]|nr:hypothetical protein [Gammaproteobacteria bacterium]
MENLVQQINFYQLSLKPKKTSFSAKTMLMMAGIAVLGLVAISAISIFQTKDIEDELQAQMSEKNSLKDSLEEAKIALKPREKSHLLTARKSRIENNLKDARRLSAIIRSETAKNNKLYSDYFRGLAQTTIQGLWLQRITISDGSNEFGLSGNTLKPELVPRLLQKLSELSVFQGTSFNKVLFKRDLDEPENGINFELTTSKLEEGSADAG